MSDSRVIILDQDNTVLLTSIASNPAFMPVIPRVGEKVRVNLRLYLVKDVITEYLEGSGTRVEVRTVYHSFY
jgi:hypothetical protein